MNQCLAKAKNKKDRQTVKDAMELVGISYQMGYLDGVNSYYDTPVKTPITGLLELIKNKDGK